MHQTFPKPAPRVTVKRQRKAHDELAYRLVCKTVNLRDGYRCRVCGRPCDPSAPDMLRKGHHHHIVYRSHGGNDTSDNLVLLDAECHFLIHAHKLDVRGNPDHAIEVWRCSDAHGWYLAKRERSVRVWERD